MVNDMSLICYMYKTPDRVLISMTASGGRETPSRAEYSSLSASGLLKRNEKTLSLCLAFTFILFPQFALSHRIAIPVKQSQV